MRYIKTKDIAHEKNEGRMNPGSDYRMRKLANARFKNRVLQAKRQIPSQVEDPDSPQQYAEEQVSTAERNLAGKVYTHTVRTKSGTKDRHHVNPAKQRSAMINMVDKGAADSAAPFFGTRERSVTSNGNHWSSNGIPIGKHLPGNIPQTYQTQRVFKRQKQAEMFVRQSRTRSLSSHYSAKTRLNKTGDRIRETVRRASKTVANGTRNLYVLLAGGSIIPLIITILICSIGLAVSSAFGIFFSGQNTGSGKTMQAMVQELNEEYQNKISDIKASVSHDYLDLSGQAAIWREVLAVYAVRAASGTDAVDVASFDENKIALLKETFWDMNSLSSNTETIIETIETEEEDNDGNIVVRTEVVEKTVLKIRASYKNAYGIATEYGFDEEQRLKLSELLSDDNNSLWAAVLYGIYDDDDYLISSAVTSRVGNFYVEVYMKGPMIWPLDSRYHTITDSFGFRIHPIKKIGHNHTGTDIGAPEGAKIYAVLPGTVTAAGESGGYGYRVIIDHGDGVSTLYAHASRILVSVGDIVEQGDTIALVGETGTATGPHLHIEVRINNTPQDAMNYLETR